MHTSKFIRTDSVVDAVNWQFDALSHSANGAGTRFAAKPGDAPATEYQRGLRQGLGEGFRAGAAHQLREHGLQQEQSTAALDNVIGAMQKQFAGIEQNIAQTLTDLAFKIARQVIRADLSVNAGSVAQVAREALSNLAERAMHPVIWLHPADIALVRTANTEMLAIRGCRIDADPTITRGGCRVESESMTIDATVETRFKQALASMGYSIPAASTSENGQDNVATDR